MCIATPLDTLGSLIHEHTEHGFLGMATLEVGDLTPFWMTKIQIYNEDGIYRGGQLDLDTDNALNCRVWPGRPCAGCTESLIDASGFGNPIEDGCWFLIFSSDAPQIEGAAPEGQDGVDVNSHAIRISAGTAMRWLERLGLEPPEDLVAWISREESTGDQDPDRPTTDTLMTDGQCEVWELLDGQAMTAKELAAQLPGRPSEEAVRQRVREIKRSGQQIANKPGRGYYRPDSPPDDLRLTAQSGP
ncbi:MAG: hypothetical protein NCW75_03925 [Phycisphaera sp.]|nr:MAG: hypothetical protein NCW75_03925 [Phycisphaera sp.]